MKASFLRYHKGLSAIATVAITFAMMLGCVSAGLGQDAGVFGGTLSLDIPNYVPLTAPDNIVFSGASSGSLSLFNTVAGSENVTLTNNTVASSSNDILSGFGGATIGGGEFTLTGPNSYTSATNISAGTLQIGGDSVTIGEITGAPIFIGQPGMLSIDLSLGFVSGYGSSGTIQTASDITLTGNAGSLVMNPNTLPSFIYAGISCLAAGMINSYHTPIIGINPIFEASGGFNPILFPLGNTLTIGNTPTIKPAFVGSVAVNPGISIDPGIIQACDTLIPNPGSDMLNLTEAGPQWPDANAPAILDAAPTTNLPEPATWLQCIFGLFLLFGFRRNQRALS